MVSIATIYKELDWSKAAESLSKWEKDRKPEERDYEDFKKEWRCTLLAYSLPHEATLLDDWTPERSQEARYQLHIAGVWPQVVKLLIKHNIMEVNEDATTKDSGRDEEDSGRDGRHQSVCICPTKKIFKQYRGRRCEKW